MKRLLTMMLALILCVSVCFAEDVGAAEDSGWILTQYITPVTKSQHRNQHSHC